MQQIDVEDATQSLPALVAQVEAGDEVLLTRGGRAVARIVPEGVDEPSELTPAQRARARKAIAGIKALAERLNLGPFDMEQFKRDRDESRL